MLLLGLFEIGTFWRGRLIQGKGNAVQTGHFSIHLLPLISSTQKESTF